MSRPIVALPPIASAPGAAVLPPGAPAVAAGGVCGAIQVTAAKAERRSRKRLRGFNPALVTAAEVSSAEIREAAVIDEAQSAAYPPVQPAWFGPAVAAAVGPAVAAAVGPAVAAAVGPAVGPAVAAAIAPLMAASANVFSRSRNRAALAGGNPATPLVPLQKELVGVGAFPGIAVAPAGYVAAPVGGLPAAGFPATVGILSGMTIAQIDSLAHFYNNSFGIGAGDLVGARREKLRAWLSY